MTTITKPRRKRKATAPLKPSAAMPIACANSTARTGVKPNHTLSELCAELQRLQRNRTVVLKSRIMVENRLVASVATFNGYRAGMDEAERKKRFDEARELVDSILAGDADPLMLGDFVKAHQPSIEAFDYQVKGLEKQMKAIVQQLPVVAWVEQSDQSGFGLLSLAIIVGETGNLANYAAPAKLWRRMSCYAYTSRGKTLMGATWRGKKEGVLSNEEWSDYGYCPRRRSIMYVIGECLLKANKGPYRARYDYAKQSAAAKHTDWKPMHCHLHAMLLMEKLLLKELWKAWNPSLVLQKTY